MSKYDAYLDWGFGFFFLHASKYHILSELGLLNAVGGV